MSDRNPWRARRPVAASGGLIPGSRAAMVADMRRDWMPGFALLLAILSPGCGTEQSVPARGATGPRVLLDKLLTGLDTLDPQTVSGCFDAATPEGSKVAELARKAVAVLAQGREIEVRARERFGAAAVERYVALPGAGRWHAALRRRLRQEPLRVDGERAYLGTMAGRQTELYQRNGVWYLAVPTPFAGDPALCADIGALLDLFRRHNHRAKGDLERATKAEDWPRLSRALAKESGAAAAPLVGRIVSSLAAHGLLWK